MCHPIDHLMMWPPNVFVVFTFLRSVTLLPMALHGPTLFRRVGVLGLSQP
jgi:hypothetical protein